MLMRETDEYFAKGVAAFVNGHHHLALACFEQTPDKVDTPQGRIYLALCLAKARGDYEQAIALAQEALRQEPRKQEYYLHLGRINLMADRRRQAIDAFSRGLQLGRNEEIDRELASLGCRKPPVFESLGRSHPLNKYLGKMLSKFGLR